MSSAVRLVLVLTLLNLVSMTGTRMMLSLYAVELGAEPVTIGFIAATFSVLGVLLSVQIGKFADRFGSRRILIHAAMGGGLGLLAPLLWKGMTGVFVAAAIVGLSWSVFFVLLQTLVGLASTAETRARNFTTYTLVGSVGALIGPTAAGFAIDFLGHSLTLTLFALITVAPIFVLMPWGEVLPREGMRNERPIHTSLRSLLAHPGVLLVLVINALQNGGKDLYQVYMPVYTHSVGLSPSAIGLVMASCSAAFFAVRTVLPPIIARYGEHKVMAFSFFVGGASLLLVPLTANPLLLSAISFLFGLGMGCSAPVVMTLMFSVSPAGRSGEAMGLRMTVTHLTKMVGPVMFGAIASGFGLMAMFGVNALMLSAGGVLSRKSEPQSSGRK